MVSTAPTVPDELYADPVQAVVLGDFGRAAGVNFCPTITELEREHINEVLGPQRTFYDEYRRLTLSLDPVEANRSLRRLASAR